ncbi:putative G-protein coupled receptor 139 [Cetorhinus maximus]
MAVVDLLVVFLDLILRHITIVYQEEFGFLYDIPMFWTTIEILHNILTPGVPFVLILLLNVFTIRHTLVTSRGRRRFRDHSSVNLLGIVILSRGKCGLSTCTTRYLVAMATADLLVIITDVILIEINYYYFPVSFLYITPVCRVRTILLAEAMDCSVWFTVTFSFDRFVAIRCQKLKTKYCTGKTAAVVLATTGILLGLKNIPFYFTVEPGEMIDNVPWFCMTRRNYFTDPGWVGFSWFDQVVTPLLPFGLILLINALTVRHILVTSRVRKGLRAQNKGENRSDPEMESRRKSMVLLFTISGIFILLWLVLVVEFFYSVVRGLFSLTYHEYILQQVGFMLRSLSCCTNTFIYGVTQSKFREQIKNAVKYPVTSMIQLMKRNNRLPHASDTQRTLPADGQALQPMRELRMLTDNGLS